MSPTMPTPSIKETISAHDEGEDLPRMGSDQSLTSIARAIWSIRREVEDRCDIELEDCHPEDSVWKEAAAVLALSAAPQSDGWRPISEAPKDGVWQDGHNHYGEYILVWYLGALRPLRARWWFRDDTEASNFIADGGYAVFPEVFMDLPTPPKMTQTEGQSHGE